MRLTSWGRSSPRVTMASEPRSSHMCRAHRPTACDQRAACLRGVVGVGGAARARTGRPSEPAGPGQGRQAHASPSTSEPPRPRQGIAVSAPGPQAHPARWRRTASGLEEVLFFALLFTKARCNRPSRRSPTSSTSSPLTGAACKARGGRTLLLRRRLDRHGDACLVAAVVDIDVDDVVIRVAAHAPVVAGLLEDDRTDDGIVALVLNL